MHILKFTNFNLVQNFGKCKQSCNYHCSQDIEYFHHTKSAPHFGPFASQCLQKTCWDICLGIHSPYGKFWEQFTSSLYRVCLPVSPLIWLLSFLRVMFCNFQDTCFTHVLLHLPTSNVFHAIVNGIAF